MTVRLGGVDVECLFDTELVLKCGQSLKISTPSFWLQVLK